MPGGFGTSGPWGSSGDSYVGGSSPSNSPGHPSNNNFGWAPPSNNNFGWGNDPQGEFGDSPTVIQESEDDYYEDDGYWDPPVGTDPPINYVPGQTSDVEDFISAYGGLSYDWVDPDSAFFTEDIWGNPLPDHGDDWYTGGGLWNPFYAGEDPNTGQPIWLTESQFHDMMNYGEGGFPWETEVQTGVDGPVGPNWGGWSWPGGGNYGGSIADLGGIMARRWNTLMKNRGNFNSSMPEYYASLKNPGQPRNQEMFENMMANIHRV